IGEVGIAERTAAGTAGQRDVCRASDELIAVLGNDPGEVEAGAGTTGDIECAVGAKTDRLGRPIRLDARRIDVAPTALERQVAVVCNSDGLCRGQSGAGCALANLGRIL